jgi:hypothetical protein
LQFDVDKKKYATTGGNDPLICAGKDCASPVINQQFNGAVNRLPLQPQLVVTPAEQDGLSYDPATLAIIGKPNRIGFYYFNINTVESTDEPRVLRIFVDTDPKDTPVFKTDATVPSATPDQDYQLNLMDLIEPKKGFMITNQVQFRLDPNYRNPSWLSIDKENPTIMKGHVPFTSAGSEIKVTLRASSNTGGSSEPFTIKIPVASDPGQKPTIQDGIEITRSAHDFLQLNMASYINDPANDNSLKVILDSVHPVAPWLSAPYMTELSGVIPDNAVGQTYKILLHANTATGGNSDPATVLLHIGINKQLTPFIIRTNNLPVIYEGQPYFYDFNANNAVYPDQKDFPYTVEFAEGYDNPSWLRLENNKLIADNIPEDLEYFTDVFLTVKNVPGGISQVQHISLFFMRSIN